MRPCLAFLLAIAGMALAGCRRQAAPTRVIAFAPAAAPARAARVTGSCWTHSIAAPGRRDAWRCTVGNAIQDPCFALPGGGGLLCGANPAAPAAAHPLLLQLTQPLPPAAVPAMPAHAWLVQLAGGVLCRPFTGTRPVAASGAAATYACAAHPHGAPGLLLFGALEPHDGGVWTAQAGTLTPTPGSRPHAAGLHAVVIAAVWQ